VNKDYYFAQQAVQNIRSNRKST